MNDFLFSSQFIPHGHCYLWKPGLVGLHILADALIALAYYSIPLMLVYFVWQRRDFPFKGMFLLFGTFIIACGTTHVMNIWTLWHPTYWLSGLLKALTAMLSVATAVELAPLIPKALALPSPTQLEAVNRELANEITKHQRTEETLRNNVEHFSAIIATQSAIATAGLDMNTVMALIVERTQQLTKASGAVIELVEGDEMVYRSASGTAVSHIGMRLHIATSLSGRCAQTNEILRCDDAEIDSRVDVDACRQVGVRSMIVVPMNHHSKVIGVLKVLSPEAYAFNERDLNTLQLMAGLLSAKLDKASEFEAKQALLVELKQVESALRQAHDELELRVEQRTKELTQTNEALLASEQRFRFLADAMPLIVWTARPDGYLDYYNNHWYEFTGFAKGEGDESWKPVLHPDDVEPSYNRWYEAVRTGVAFRTEFRLLNCKSRSYRWHLGQALPMRNETGDIIQWVGTITDINDQKRAVEELATAHEQLDFKVQEQTAELYERRRIEEKLQASLQEKEVLLKEVHHRVKNNFQIISSLLNLQSSSLHDERCQEVFKISQKRIESMALVHEKLYLSENLAQIDFADYIKALVDDLLCSYPVNLDDIDFQITTDRAFLSLETAISCGLIINELVLNAFKYAFPKGISGKICINFRSEGDNRFSLAVSDNGIGFPQDLDFKNTESLGLQLVNALTGQLGGTIELSREQGTEFKITF